MKPPLARDDDAPGEDWQAAVLAAWRTGQRRSMVGPGPVEPHLDHAARLADLIGSGVTTGVDLGTGVGIPGLALAGFLPRTHWTLVDAAARRITIVAATIEALGWADRVAAVHARAERVPALGIAGADVVVARLLGPPAATAECAAPIVALGGRVLVTEPPGAASPDRWSADGLRALGFRLGPRTVEPAIQTLDAVEAPEPRFPRKPGMAWKRPLW